jgi:hypothetical protein
MRLYKTILVLTSFLSVIACQSVVDDINTSDPNKISNVDGQSLFTGMALANIVVQSGYLNWTSNIWTGQLIGAGRFGQEQNYEQQNLSTNIPWSNIYFGVLKQARVLRSGIRVSNKNFFYGASKVLEAYAVGTAASLFGDVPFREASNDEIPSPAYDPQTEVYSDLQNLLDEAISDLQASGTEGGIAEDIFFGGDSNKWVKVAYTLKARLYLETRDYNSAMTAAQMGISSESESMKFFPPAVAGENNLLYGFFTGSYPNDLDTDGTFLIDLLGTGSASRNNSKTDEIDRVAYYYDGNSINLNGIAAIDEPMNQVSYQENLLTWAEAALRANVGNFDTALEKLNEHRSNLRNGVYFPQNAGVYDDYVEADFVAGGIENVDGSLTKEDALLREIIEERYVSFFVNVVAFLDIRRVEKDPTALQVPVPFNAGSQRPQRFLYPFDEVNTNGENVPAISDIFVKTPINQ